MSWERYEECFFNSSNRVVTEQNKHKDLGAYAKRKVADNFHNQTNWVGSWEEFYGLTCINV